MNKESDVYQGPSMDVNVKNRAPQPPSNNGDKNIREHGRQKRRDFPRGSHDPSAFPNPEPRRQHGGGRRNHHQRHQPTPRGGAHHSATGDQAFAGAVMMDDEFEVGSVFNPGAKKTNLNHLLNFQFEPRRSMQKKGKNSKFSSGSSKPKYNKEQYIQANCQFVVKSSGDYTVHLTDPDILVDWDLIEQVILKTTESVPSCPICLYPPKAAKIARCGHVFCWPCILHYLALSDHKWRKCPICYEAIHRPDLKSVISVPWKEFQINDEIELCLMRRERNSLFALPVDRYFPEVNEKHPNLSEKFTSHSNLILADPGQVIRGIISKERFELEEQYRDEKDEPEACFIEEALQYLSQREAGIDMTQFGQDLSIAEENVTEDSPSSDEGAPETFPLDFKEEDEAQARPRYASSSSDGTNEDILAEDQITADDLVINDKKANSSPKETFYFYQSSDGQPIYLHALNVQMLVHEYGSLENCPKKIKGKIIEKDNASMTEALRNRLRYLRHMPLTSVFEVCEIQLKQPLISKETLQEFSSQLEARRRKRNRRAREERRREKWITVEENKKMGKYPDMKCRIESAFHFPQVGAAGITAARSTESIDSTLSNGSSLEPDGSFSFAKMLREGVAKPSTLAPKPPMAVAMAASISPKKNDDSEPEPEGYVPPPPKASLGDALAHAFAQATTVSGGAEPKRNTKKGKKMKGQKISLTGSARPLMD